MRIKEKGLHVVTVAYSSQLGGIDPADWAHTNPGRGYAFTWPGVDLPEVGTWARTPEGGSVVVVAHYTRRPGELKTLVT